MRRILALFLCIVFLFALSVPVIAQSTFGSKAVSGQCGDDLTWSFDFLTGELSISGTGPMYDYDSYYPGPWYNYRDDITSLNISYGVTRLGRYAFYKLNITSVDIPSSVSKIDEGAFFACFYLQNVSFQEGVSEICTGAFASCWDLSSVILPTSITKLGEGAFSGNDLLYAAIFTGEPPTFDSGVFNGSAQDFCIYYYSECASSWAPNGETEFAGYPLANVPIVTFMDPIGNCVIASQEVLPRESATAPEPPEHFGYVFTGWSCAFDYVTNNLTVYALYDAAHYLVIFTDGFGTIISEQDVPFLSSATEPALPEHEGYSFAGWDADFSCIMANLTVNATWEVNYYTVTFFDPLSDETLSVQTVAYGSSAQAPADPEHEGYTFAGWDADFSCIEADLTVNATWDINYYTVVFYDPIAGEAISFQSVAYGSAAEAPEAPEHEGYTFVGWDSEFDFITDNTVVNAIYERNVIPGDADGDGSVTSLDALMAFRATMGLLVPTLEMIAACDFNGDGVISSTEALTIMRFVMLLIPEL